MSGNTIVSGDGGDMYDQSILDQGLNYPAAMAGLPTSTPNPGTLTPRRRSRRSWFETTPKGFKFDIAIEKPEIKKPVRPSSENVEVLTLTHFSAAPRLGFGNLKPGQQRTCTLLLRNPHDYEQSVRVEKVPEKKHFTVPCREFVVGPEESYPLEITWSPKDPGGYREMILMQVDNSYRVQAYVFGTVIAPPPKKKKTGKRTGLLASKATRPFSVIHTSSLSNINHQYSPEKKFTKPAGVRPTAQQESKTKHVTKPVTETKKRRSSKGSASEELRRRSARLSGQGLKEDVYQPQEVHTGDENVDPAKTHRTSSSRFSGAENMANDPSVRRKKLRRSNTYSNVSVGLIVPIIQNEEVKGHKNTSLLNIEDCNISGIAKLEESHDLPKQKKQIPELPSFLEDRNASVTVPNAVAMEPSFLVEEELIEKRVAPTNTQKVETYTTGANVRKKVEIDVGKDFEPSFILQNKTVQRCNETFQDSLEMPADKDLLTHTDEPSFLLNESTAGKARKRSIELVTEDDNPTSVKLLRNGKKCNTESKRLITKGESNTGEGSPILTQLRTLRSYIHDRSLEIEHKNDEDKENNRCVDRRETFAKQKSSPRFSMPAVEDLRRGTFVVDAAKMKLLETQQPSEASPRRTTFTVVKDGPKQINKTGVGKVEILTEEDEEAESEDKSETVVKEEFVKEENRGLEHKYKRAYSNDSLEGDGFEEQFGSPQPLPEAPGEEFTRRATLTVTKTRPSDALLEHAHRQSLAAAALFKPITGASPSARVADGLWKEQTDGTPSQNSTFEVSAERSFLVKDAGFQATPNRLPVSPNPDHSRRSTHVVHKPKVLNLSSVTGRQLFELDSQVEIIDEGESASKDAKETEEKPEDKAVDLTSPPSANTRRRRTLSAKRHLTGSKLSASATDSKAIWGDKEQLQETEVPKQSKAEEKLMFIPLNEPLEKEKIKPVKLEVSKPNPKNFLKKRSGSLTQEAENGVAKRLRSERQPPVQKPVASLMKKDLSSVALVPKRKPVQKTKPNLGKGLAQSKLILTKKCKAAPVRHPLPFAGRNMFYDERWMEKQEQGFVNWLNFILTPAEEIRGSDVKVKVDAGKLTLDIEKGRGGLAPTNEILSFRAYQAHRKLNRLRKSACRLFQSDSMRQVMHKVEREVESRRLLVRRDKMIHADVGAKHLLLDMLLSYNLLWLRVGLETVYGEIVPMQCNTDVYSVSRFIVARVLASPDIAQEYAHPTVPHLYKDGYAEASAQHTLKKILMLVYFLDQAKSHRLIEHNPCLFCKDAEIKTSRDLLLRLSRDFLSGEGDITRHLGYLGYKVGYSQTALDEFDFAVKNLATELRDGVRLTRVMELLCDRTDITSSLRMPAISKLQKVHNMKLAFQAIDQQHISHDGVTAQDIVEGHRERTLKLLWSVILHYQVATLLPLDQLQQEIDVLERSLRVKHQLHRLANYKHGTGGERRDSAGLDLHTKDEKLNLLLKWCKAVCAHFDLQIENFTVSFSDGRALCHIVHYYHPGLLPLAAIHNHTMLTHMDSVERKRSDELLNSFNDSANSSAVFAEVDDDPALVKQLLGNEKENFKLLSDKVGELGGVPLMLHAADMSNTVPDEKVVVTYLLYLCARLLDIRHESRAARTIQHAWRAYRLRKAQHEYKEKEASVVVLQRAVRRWLGARRELRRVSAAVCIQRVWRGHQARKRAATLRLDRLALKQQEAVTQIQVSVRSFLYRRRFLRMKAAMEQIQAYSRGYLHRRQHHAAAVTIQRIYRGYCARRRLQEMTFAVTSIQAHIRGWFVRRQLLAKQQAASLIQSRYRAWTAMKHQQQHLQTVRQSCCHIQHCWRQYVARRGHKRTAAATVIQSVLRGYKIRTQYQRLLSSVLKIQSAVRGYQQRQKMVRLRKAVLLIQTRYRAKLEGAHVRREFLVTKQAAVTLQSQWKMLRERRKFCAMKTAATKIQANIRMMLVRRRYQRMQSAAIKIQSAVRCYRVCKAYKVVLQYSHEAATRIQAAYKGYTVRREFLQQKQAAVTIQSCFRGYTQLKHFTKLKCAVTMCQATYRAKLVGRQARKQYETKKHAAVVLQSGFRGYKCRRDYYNFRAHVIKMQALIRMKQVRGAYLRQRLAVVKIQQKFRATLAARRARKAFLIQIGAVITIQAWYKASVVRRLYLQTIAARKIQAMYRMYAARKAYLRILAARKIQSTFRMYRARKAYLRIIAARKIQSTFRMYRARKEYRRTLAARKIQSMFRMFKAQKNYQRYRARIVVCQCAVRGWLARQTALQLKQKHMAAITIQTAYRAWSMGKQQRLTFLKYRQSACVLQKHWREYVTRRNAAIKIQTWYRSIACRARYTSLKAAVIVCQRKLRAKRMCKVSHDRYVQMKCAAVKIQSVFRRYQCRKRFLSQQHAAVKIQSLIRMIQARCMFVQQRSAAVSIQQWYRSTVQRRKLRKQHLVKIGAAICIQAAFKCYRTRQTYSYIRRNIIKIQSVVRGHLARKQFKEMQRCNKAAVIIQQRWRARQKAAEQLAVFTAQRRAAMKIQGFVRAYQMGRKCRQEFVLMKAAANTIQAAYRRYLVQKQMMKETRAASRIQAVFRGWRTVREYKKLQTTVVMCQQLVRAKQIGQKDRARFIQFKSSAVTLQAQWRMLQSRRAFVLMANSAIRIQSWYRGTVARREFKQQQRAALVLQMRWRAELQCRKQFLAYQRLRDAGITVQSHYRGKCVRRNLIERKAATKIQACWRGAFARWSYLGVKAATVRIQCSVRVWLARRELAELRTAREQQRQGHLERVAGVARVHMAVLRIQRAYRQHRIMQLASHKLHSVLLLQNWMRACLQRKKYLRARQGVVRIQACVRMWLARRHKTATVIQRAARRWLAARAHLKLHIAATAIQCVWRGYRVRRDCRSKRLSQARARIQVATAAATEDQKLGNRTSSALDFLLRDKSLSHVLEALMHLDVATRLSWVCCERMVETNAISVLCRLVRGCNRSVPHMELIKYTVSILLNLAKYEKTRSSVYDESTALSTLLDLLQVYREKPAIFNKTCTLLGILALDAHCKRTILENTKFVEKLRSIQTLTARKHKLETERVSTRARMNATLNSTFVVRSPVKKVRVKPDWSLHKDKMSEMDNPLKAINFVLINLGLQSKTGR